MNSNCCFISGSAPAMMSPKMKLSKSGNYDTENKENTPPPSAARKLKPSPQKFGPYSVAQPVQSSNIAQYSVAQQSSGNLTTYYIANFRFFQHDVLTKIKTAV